MHMSTHRGDPRQRSALERIAVLFLLWTNASFADSSIERISNFVFAPTVIASGYTQALVYADRGYSFESLEEINKYNIRSAYVIEGTAQQLDLADRPIESQYWWSVHTQGGAEQFIRGLALTLQPELSGNRQPDVQVPRAVLAKALAQRDMVHTYGLLVAAADTTSDPDARMLATRLERLLVNTIGLLLLSESEFRELRSLLPKRVPNRFSTVPADTLSASYLPSRVIAEDDSWMEMPNGGEPFRHFTSYGGRSFIKIYLRSAQLTTNEIADLWRSLFQRYGEDLHTTGIEEATPPGFETMLVRTFGVFLVGGEYADSLWPEEVTIRRFKYATDRVDSASSDFRGTQFFQYKLARSLALRKPASLGLRRIRDDDWQFYGFYGDVPDRGNSYSDAVTTMRGNCIACHSELFYGLNTVFSFERNPDKSTQRRSQSQSGPKSEELETLQRRLLEGPLGLRDWGPAACRRDQLSSEHAPDSGEGL